MQMVLTPIIKTKANECYNLMLLFGSIHSQLGIQFDDDTEDKYNELDCDQLEYYQDELLSG